MHVFSSSAPIFFSRVSLTYFTVSSSTIKDISKIVLDSGKNISEIDIMRTSNPNVNHLTNLIGHFDLLLEYIFFVLLCIHIPIIIDNVKETLARNNSTFINKSIPSDEPSEYSLKLIVLIMYTATNSSNKDNQIICIIIPFIEHDDGSILL